MISINKTHLYLAIVCLLFFNVGLYKVPYNNTADWSKPFPAFQIVGNVYYVGTYELSSYLIVTDNGNILINTGMEGSLEMIKKNIADLGFRYCDIKMLLTTQAHYDHLGAMAAIKRETGAKFWADAAEADALKSGATDHELNRFGESFQPVVADSLLKDKSVIQLGNTKLVLLHHPGHTKGSCSYMFTVNDKNRSYEVLIANMPSIVADRNFSEALAYPNIESDYAYTFRSMKQLKFDIWLASHAAQFDLHKKHNPGDPYNPAAFIDRAGYTKSLDALEQRFLKKQKQQ
ncbi:MAG: subclass B3 metallo-beta-lactamase [Agriterribacter sp.]